MKFLRSIWKSLFTIERSTRSESLWQRYPATLTQEDIEYFNALGDWR